MLKTTQSLVLKSLSVVWLLTMLILATPSRASAYTDPGTGAFVYQAIYAAFVGGAFYFRKFLGKLWVKRK
jgi:hypothetical protein